MTARSEKKEIGNETLPIKVELISTVSQHHSGAISESLGLEALAGHLTGENGSQVEVGHTDCQLTPDLKPIIEHLRKKVPHIIGISVKIGGLKQTQELIEGINNVFSDTSDKPLIAMGGVVPTFASNDLLELYPNVIMAVGEGERTIQGLVEHIRFNLALEQIPGLQLISDSNRIETKPDLLSLDKIHPPARITTKEVYQRDGIVWFEGSRGCNGHCTFCSRKALRGSGFSGAIPPEKVVDEMERLLNMGINSINASDDDWSGDPERSLQIVEEIIRRELNQMGMKFTISTRADHIFQEKGSLEENMRLRYIMEKHAEAGLTRVFLGLESGSSSQLKRYGKQISAEANLNAIKILKDIGIEPVAGYIPIDPLMTPQELEETTRFLRESGMYLKVTNPLSVLRIQEGSSYKNILEKRGMLGSKTSDLVFYDVKEFANHQIQIIADLLKEWVDETYEIIFGLKNAVASATLKYGIKDERSRKLQDLLYLFREIEMELIEALVAECKIDGDQFSMRKIVSDKKKKRDSLIKQFDSSSDCIT